MSISKEENNVQAIVKETLRLEPPIRKTVRYAREDTQVAGLKIVKNCQIGLDLYQANRDPEIFEFPNDWMPNRTSAPIVTFGYGLHACPGSRLALAELETVCEFLLNNWKVLTESGKIPASTASNKPDGITFRGAKWLDAT